jgi:hypothetical protein
MSSGILSRDIWLKLADVSKVLTVSIMTHRPDNGGMTFPNILFSPFVPSAMSNFWPRGSIEIKHDLLYNAWTGRSKVKYDSTTNT